MNNVMRMLNKKMNTFFFLNKKKMEIIDFSWMNLRPKHILEKLIEIEKKDEIISIDLEGNFFNLCNLSKLFKYIGDEFKNLERLNLSTTNIAIQEFYIICSHLKNYEKLKSLNLSHNIITKRSVYYLNDVISRLEELDLSYNFLKSQGINILSNFFERMENLKTLKIISCNLHTNDIYMISEKIGFLKKLENFSIEKNICSSSIFAYLLLQIPKKKNKMFESK